MTDCMFCILEKCFFLGLDQIFETNQNFITEEEEIYMRES